MASELPSFMFPAEGAQHYQAPAMADTEQASIRLSRVIDGKLAENPDFVNPPSGPPGLYTRDMQLYLPNSRIRLLQGSGPTTDFAVGFEGRPGQAHLYAGGGQVVGTPSVSRYDFTLEQFREVVTDPSFEGSRYAEILIDAHFGLYGYVGRTAIGEIEAFGLEVSIEHADPRFMMRGF